MGSLFPRDSNLTSISFFNREGGYWVLVVYWPRERNLTRISFYKGVGRWYVGGIEPDEDQMNLQLVTR